MLSVAKYFLATRKHSLYSFCKTRTYRLGKKERKVYCLHISMFLKDMYMFIHTHTKCCIYHSAFLFLAGGGTIIHIKSSVVP